MVVDVYGVSSWFTYEAPGGEVSDDLLGLPTLLSISKSLPSEILPYDSTKSRPSPTLRRPSITLPTCQFFQKRKTKKGILLN